MTPYQPNPDTYYQSITSPKDIVLEKNSSPSKEQVQQIVKCCLHQVGKGSFGIVYKNLQPNFDSVFKVGKNSLECLKEFESEAKMYEKIAENGGSKHLTHKFDFLIHDKCPILKISSFVSSFNLTTHFHINPCLQIDARTFLDHTLEGLNYLHNTCKITHGDIKPSNILIYLKCPKNPERDQFVITDFGNSSELYEENVPLGVVEFRHPGVNLGKRSTYPQNDLWAIGATLYWCITKNFLPKIPEENYEKFNTSELPSEKIQKKLFQYIRERFPKEKKEQLDKLIPEKFRTDKAFMTSLEDRKSNIWYQNSYFQNFLKCQSLHNHTTTSEMKKNFSSKAELFESIFEQLFHIPFNGAHSASSILKTVKKL